MDFILNYILFYSDHVNSIATDRAVLIISKIFPAKCTNKIKLKYFITKYIEDIAVNDGYDKNIMNEVHGVYLLK